MFKITQMRADGAVYGSLLAGALTTTFIAFRVENIFCALCIKLKLVKYIGWCLRWQGRIFKIAQMRAVRAVHGSLLAGTLTTTFTAFCVENIFYTLCSKLKN